MDNNGKSYTQRLTANDAPTAVANVTGGGGASTFYKTCKDQRPSFLEESLGRFVNPLAISYVRIPANVWPSNMVGDESTGSLLGNTRTVRSSTVDNFDAVFVEQLAAELQRYGGRNSGGKLGGAQSSNNAPLSALQLLHQHVTEATNNRINYVSLRKLTVDQANVAERNDACVASAFELCTFRISDAIRNADNVTTFCQMTRKVRESVVDIKQCQTLLRKTVRACNQTYESTPVPDFDKLQAVNEIMASGGVDFLLKEYVAFISALQTRKWMNMVNVKVLTIKLRDLEREKTKAARKLNETVAREAYTRLSERLQSEQTSAQHVTSQLTMMRKLINATRYHLNQMYAHLFGRWNELSECTRRSMDMLRAFNLHPPPIVCANFQRDVYVLDLFKTLEVVRSANTFLLKYVEDKYDFVYELFSPTYLRPISAAGGGGQSSTGNRNYLLGSGNGGGQRDAEKLRTQAIEAINYFSNKLLETRANYRKSRYYTAATDVRHLVLAYQRFVKCRMEYLLHLVATDVSLDSLELEPISEHSIRQRVRDKLKSISTNDVDRKVANWFNEHEMEACAEILNLNFERRPKRRARNSEDSDVEMADEESATATASANNDHDDVRAPFEYKCRPIGDTMLMLRELQDVYDYEYMAQTLDQQLDRLLVQRYQASADRVNVDSEFAKWDDRQIAEELESNIRATFNETLGTWDRLIQRVSTIEQQANSDMNSWNGRVARNEISERINCWLYRNYDDFNFTVLHAKFTLLDSADEVRTVLKNFSHFAYLLSWLLEMRAFVPTNYRAQASPPESESESSDEEPPRKPPRTVNIKNVIRADEHLLQEQPTFTRTTTYNQQRTYNQLQQQQQQQPDGGEQVDEIAAEQEAEAARQENLGQRTLPAAPTAAEIDRDETARRRPGEPTLDDLIGAEEAARIRTAAQQPRRIDLPPAQRNAQKIDADVVNINNLNVNRDRRLLDQQFTTVNDTYDAQGNLLESAVTDTDETTATGEPAGTARSTNGPPYYRQPPVDAAGIPIYERPQIGDETRRFDDRRPRERFDDIALSNERRVGNDAEFDDEDFERNLDDQLEQDFRQPVNVIGPARTRGAATKRHSAVPSDYEDEYGRPKRARFDQQGQPLTQIPSQYIDQDVAMPEEAGPGAKTAGRRRVSTGRSTTGQGTRRFRDPTNDALRGTSRPTIARQRQNVNQGLQRLRRIADNAPSEMGVGLLNNAYRNEMRKKKTIRSRIRNNLTKLRDKLGIPEFKFERID